MSPACKDIEAEVTFIHPKEGGRKNPIFSGYRPQFYYDDHDWDASLWFDGPSFPVDNNPVRVYFCFFSLESHIGKLIPGKEFELREGKKLSQRAM